MMPGHYHGLRTHVHNGWTHGRLRLHAQVQWAMRMQTHIQLVRKLQVASSNVLWILPMVSVTLMPTGCGRWSNIWFGCDINYLYHFMCLPRRLALGAWTWRRSWPRSWRFSHFMYLLSFIARTPRPNHNRKPEKKQPCTTSGLTLKVRACEAGSTSFSSYKRRESASGEERARCQWKGRRGTLRWGRIASWTQGPRWSNQTTNFWIKFWCWIGSPIL